MTLVRILDRSLRREGATIHRHHPHKRKKDRGRERLTPGSNRPHERKRIHDEREPRPKQQNNITHQPKRSHPKRSVANVIPSPDEQTHDGDGIGHVQQHDTRCHHAVESRIAPNVQQTQQQNDDVGHDMRAHRHIKPAIDMRQPFRARHPTVPCETPTQSRLPRVRSDQTPHPRRDEHGLENDSASFRSQRLVVEGEDGD